MPSPGEMQSSGLLTDNSLLPIYTSDEEPKLIDHISDFRLPVAPSFPISTSPLAAMMLVDVPVKLDTDTKVGSVTSISELTPEDSGESAVENSSSNSPTNTIMAPLLSDFSPQDITALCDSTNQHHLSNMDSQLPQPLSSDVENTSLLKPHNVSSSLGSPKALIMAATSPIQEVEFDVDSSVKLSPHTQALGIEAPNINVDAYTSFSDATSVTVDDISVDLKRMRPLSEESPSKRRQSEVSGFTNQPVYSQELPSNTALETRTTKAVIADLRRGRLPNSTVASQAQLQQEVVTTEGTALHVEEEFHEAAESDEGEDVEEDDNRQSKPRKITARKKGFDAAFDQYLMNRTREQIKKATEVKPEDEENQSARWLVNQSENRQIISTPREYQNELFQKAKEKNIIAVLDTGSGKTLIAVLLLRHIFAQELEDRAAGKEKRISFFLVDSVTLVFQQHAVLKANLDQPMDVFCGDMNCDLWNRELWQKHFDKNMVIVCTAEVLRQCLMHSFISIPRINLLIFDEAHHAKKDHTYARIIKDFYSQTAPGTILPKIFGMTASPVDARVDVRKSAAELEAILHAEICTTADPDLMKYTVAPSQEQMAMYSPVGAPFATPLFSQMRNRFKDNAVMRKPLLYAYEATKDLGAWCSDQIWRYCLSEEETRKAQAKTERQYHSKTVSGPIEILEKQKNLLQEGADIVKAHTFEAPLYDPAFDSSSNISSKVTLLIQYLKQRFERPTNDKCIVFVKQRYTARLLTTLFSREDIGTPYLFVKSLVGTKSGEAGDLNISFREQVLTMMNFRKGVVNCLFATSVAEEGLDIPDCNLVIRFDLYSTVIQYIQSRGRARHANSKYIHMIERGNADHQQIVTEVRRDERILKSFCSALPEDRKLTGNDFNMDYFLAKERKHRVYIVPSTQAKLTYKMSLMVLANFAESIPHGPETSLRVEYVMQPRGKEFECEVILPEGSPMRGAVGRLASTKQVAKCSAAFEACLELIKAGYLDENLLSTFTKQLPVMRNAKLAVDSKKREAYKMRTKPELWSVGGVPEELYLTILSLEDSSALDRSSQPIALLTRSKFPQLPSFILHFGGGKHSPVDCTTLHAPLSVSSEVLTRFNIFTLCLFNDIFSKEYESDISKMPYFIAPVLPLPFSNDSDPSDLIAWDILQDVENDTIMYPTNRDNKSWQTEPDEYFHDKFISDPFDGSRKLWTLGVAPEYKPLDPVPPNSAPRLGTRKNNNNILEYSCSLWSKARARAVIDPNQRVFKARLLPLRRNLLDEFDGGEAESPQECYIILEMLKISPLPTTVVAMAYLFPAIIHRIESYLIALEACDLLHLKIRPDLALEAVTKDSDNSGDHDAEKINFQRGMGNNYERLEFLGDCFLKMATSISLYGLHPDNDEYRYHVDRMLLICNANLCQNAVKLKLFEYIRSQSFSRRAWYPEGLVMKKGKNVAAPDSHNLGDKSIADVCEAMIGAALLTFHGTGNMDNAVRAVTEVVCGENHRVYSWSDYYKLYNKPKFQTAAATAMQKNLAAQVEEQHSYHFKYPRLLRSAFIHPSYPFSYERIPCYQRLEFLGDSLLDMACVNFLFHNYPGKDPQWLTEHKMAMVSNQFLGALCVELKFNTHLLVLNGTFQKQIKDYVDDIEEARRQAVADAIRVGKPASEFSPDFWTSVRHPPKCLPDLVEAYIGAIFVDSEYNYTEVERFFDEHIKKYFTNMTIYDTYANKHPTTFLTNFLQTNMGCANWTLMSRENPSEDGSKPTVIALLIVHGKVVSEYVAESSRYAKVGAAKRAVEKLQGLPLTEFRETYGCECKAEDLEEVDEGVHGTAI